MSAWGAQDLTVTYGGHEAVAGLSFELHRGAITALVGGDGAGKTSTLRALAGVVLPSGGLVSRPEKHDIGYVSAGPGIYRDLTVAENLSFAARAYGLDASSFERRARSLLEATALTEARDRLGRDLSGGMRQKLALAVVLLHEPALLILDEPTTGVDPVSRSELWLLIARAAASGAAVVLATSYIDEAERAEELVVLADGHVLLQGSPERLIASVPGALFSVPSKSRARFAWRRGAAWRTWSPDGLPGDEGGERVAPDLEDAVVVAEIARSALAMREGVAA